MPHPRTHSGRIVTGYNHNIPYRGTVYHVQTEFFTLHNPHIETHVFDDGRVVAAERTDLELREVDPDVQAHEAMKAQQKEMIRRLISGRLTGDVVETPEPASAPVPQDDERHESQLVEVAAAVGNLDLRRSLVRFVRAVAPDDEPAGEELGARLRSTLTAIAVLTGRHLFENTRQEELAEMLILRSEALEWLRHPEDAHEGEGLRLWRGFAALASNMRELNSRRQLVEHDAYVWRRILGRIEDLADEEKADHDLFASLKSTWGRHEPLDEAMDRGVLAVGTLRSLIADGLRELESLAQETPPTRRREVRA